MRQSVDWVGWGVGEWGHAWGGEGGVACVLVRLAVFVMLSSEGGGGPNIDLNLNGEYDCTVTLNNHLNADTENLLNIDLGTNYFDHAEFIKNSHDQKNRSISA
jgi:hypothetical protein